MAVDGHFTV